MKPQTRAQVPIKSQKDIDESGVYLSARMLRVRNDMLSSPNLINPAPLQERLPTPRNKFNNLNVSDIPGA